MDEKKIVEGNSAGHLVEELGTPCEIIPAGESVKEPSRHLPHGEDLPVSQNSPWPIWWALKGTGSYTSKQETPLARLPVIIDAIKMELIPVQSG